MPVYFREQYGIEPVFCGINIIGIGGRNYKTFLSLIKNFNIPWFIFSDGESSTKRIVKKAVLNTFGLNAEKCDNIIILDNEENYEKHLLNSGYINEIVEAINMIEDNMNFVKNYANERDRTVAKREKTNLPKCSQCHQDIYKDVIRDYSGAEGWVNAVYDCCTGQQAKAKYATAVAERIASISDINRRIPPKVKVLMEALKSIVKQ
ncbi:MAG: hypothetical protein LUG66_04075 [Clostridiales bacterium]|nr:hypothetical protein [Clostridiales bacterium]